MTIGEVLTKLYQLGVIVNLDKAEAALFEMGESMEARINGIPNKPQFDIERIVGSTVGNKPIVVLDIDMASQEARILESIRQPAPPDFHYKTDPPLSLAEALVKACDMIDVRQAEANADYDKWFSLDKFWSLHVVCPFPDRYLVGYLCRTLEPQGADEFNCIEISPMPGAMSVLLKWPPKKTLADYLEE